ncbi:MAG: carbon-nitrogen family hydrolase [Actinomycetota bacterium]
MRIAAVQHDIVWEDPAANHARLAPRIAEAASRGADLVVLAEMYASGFSMRTDRIAEPWGGPSVQFLVDQAAAHGVTVCGSVAEIPRAGGLPRNQLVIASADGTTHRYAKIHPFTYGGEAECYAAGDTTCTVEISGARCSFFVCYDLRFADSFWGLAHDTDCYVVTANWPSVRRPHWIALLRARAIENQAYVVGVNRVGEAPGLAYSGDSTVIDPLGETVVAAGADEEVLLAEIDPGRVAAVRAEYPFLADR